MEILSQENPVERVLAAFMRASNPFYNIIMPYGHANTAARQTLHTLDRAGLSPF